MHSEYDGLQSIGGVFRQTSRAQGYPIRAGK